MRVPWLVHSPGPNPLNLKNFTFRNAFQLYRRKHYKKRPPKIYKRPVELLDLMPTLVDLAKLPSVPMCYKHDEMVRTCTEGKSLHRLFHRNSVQNWNSGLSPLSINETMLSWSFAFSQYPRPSKEPRVNSDQPQDNDIKYMGYSIRSRRYRYTRWVPIFVNKHGN